MFLFYSKRVLGSGKLKYLSITKARDSALICVRFVLVKPSRDWVAIRQKEKANCCTTEKGLECAFVYLIEKAQIKSLYQIMESRNCYFAVFIGPGKNGFWFIHLLIQSTNLAQIIASSYKLLNKWQNKKLFYLLKNSWYI